MLACTDRYERRCTRAFGVGSRTSDGKHFHRCGERTCYRTSGTRSPSDARQRCGYFDASLTFMRGFLGHDVCGNG